MNIQNKVIYYVLLACSGCYWGIQCYRSLLNYLTIDNESFLLCKSIGRYNSQNTHDNEKISEAIEQEFDKRRVHQSTRKNIYSKFDLSSISFLLKIKTLFIAMAPTLLSCLIISSVLFLPLHFLSRLNTYEKSQVLSNESFIITNEYLENVLSSPEPLLRPPDAPQNLRVSYISS
ncbi:MAG TPA: hypothetical protein PKZ42_06655 [Syntrophales bacterium]|nr:hypothetical protein [Syntrophales bacterium]